MSAAMVVMSYVTWVPMRPAHTGPLAALSAQRITWTLGRRVVMLERRGGTWRMVPRAV